MDYLSLSLLGSVSCRFQKHFFKYKSWVSSSDNEIKLKHGTFTRMLKQICTLWNGRESNATILANMWGLMGLIKWNGIV